VVKGLETLCFIEQGNPMPISRLIQKRCAVLVLDMQEKLLPQIDQSQLVIGQVGRMIDGANALEVPVLVTEQYRKGLGETVEPLKSKLAHAVCNEEKMLFSALIPSVLSKLRELEVTQVVVCGIETHICVMQTCLDLIEKGFETAVVADAVGSRRALDHQTGMQRMLANGIVPVTVESVLLEWVKEAGTAAFKAVLPVIRPL
jgi:nicotinamidase-related amidase